MRSKTRGISRDQDDGYARRKRPRAKRRSARSFRVPAHCAQRRRRTLRSHQRWQRVPNQGVRMTPFEIINDGSAHLGKEVSTERRHSRRHRVRYQTCCAAWCSTGPLPRRRRLAARGQDRAVDNTDAWFIGFDPDITVASGWDLTKKSQRTKPARQRPRRSDGFMSAYIDNRPDKDTPPGSRPRATSSFWQWTGRTEV